MQVSSV